MAGHQAVKNDQWQGWILEFKITPFNLIRIEWNIFQNAYNETMEGVESEFSPDELLTAFKDWMELKNSPSESLLKSMDFQDN